MQKVRTLLDEIIRSDEYDIYSEDSWQARFEAHIGPFIFYAKSGFDWVQWKPEIFNEYFKRSHGQCIASVAQKYFNSSEQKEIKDNWQDIAPILKQIASNQDEFTGSLYKQLDDLLRTFTHEHKRAATLRLIAGIQPEVISTIVTEKDLDKFKDLANQYLSKEHQITGNNRFEISHQILKLIHNIYPETDKYKLVTLPWLLLQKMKALKMENVDVEDNLESKIINDLVRLLKSKKQIVLQGPPGTGKTRLAKALAVSLLALKDMDGLKDSPNCQIIQFHPSYTYEDFVRGIVAVPHDSGIQYQAQDKILAKMAAMAAANPSQNHVLIIDEINRANLSAVLGELIYALEYRGEAVESMYEVDGSRTITLPPNLYVIGAMNTADRSVGHIDYAIRRRFAFVDVLPTDLSDELGDEFAKACYDSVQKIFDEETSGDFDKRDVQLGHAYFITDKMDIQTRLDYEIKPILYEYLKDGVLKPSAKQKIDELTA